MRFSLRTAWDSDLNAWAEALEQARTASSPVIDLTISNPIACGLGPEPATLLGPLGSPLASHYQPLPFGTESARQAVVQYYSDHNASVPVEHVALATSTSEAYSFLFRLLCDPGDEILIARPSYPLFALLAGLDGLVLREYPLFYEPGTLATNHGSWSIDLPALKRSITQRTRALIVVHPNNPTGHYVSGSEREKIIALCREHQLALIVDEVFLDYQLTGPQAETFAGEGECLCFVLSGLSKVCALPQMKLSWIAASGPQLLLKEALHRLEIVADTFLSVNAPIQAALPVWLGGRKAVQDGIRSRLQENLQILDEVLRGSLGDRLAVEGGWTAVLRVPRFLNDLPFAMAALKAGIAVQPGDFYGLSEGRCVLSLLPPPALFRQGLQLLPLELKR